MNALKQLRAPLVLIVGVAFLTSAGCAGTKPKQTNTNMTAAVRRIRNKWISRSLSFISVIDE